MQPISHPRTQPFGSTQPYSGAPGPGVPHAIDDDARPQRISGTGPLRPGSHIGRYVVRNKLGRGGMGIVYGAYDPLLGRRVALKLVRHRDANEAIEVHVDERLRREAQALAQLAHPNVVSLYDLGASEHGDYLALELVPGIDLEQWLHKQTRGWRAIIDVFLFAGRGLAAAHVAGLIHRDFKPTNVIVGPHGHVTVVDFGLARSAELDPTPLICGEPPSEDQAPLLSARLTGTNLIVGTRGYMAPEQLLGLTVGPRADQFAFCVALFEALYGIRPYPGKNAVETATSFARGTLVEPDDRHGVPVRLHQALLRGLSIEPDDRFPTMEALSAALRKELPAPRGRWLLAAAWVATSLLSAGGGAWLHAQSTAAPHALRAAPSAVQPAEVQSELGPNSATE